MAIEKEIYEKFKANTDLLTLLADGENSIYEGRAPAAGPYRQLIFQNISEVPALTADNAEKLKRTTIQISIITKNGEYDDIFLLVDSDMHEIGFMFDSSIELNTTDTRTKIIRYVILREAE